MITFKDLPLFPGQETRPIEQVPADKLKEVGVNSGIFGIRKGDKLTFDATDSPVVIAQPVRANDPETKAYYVGCTRNGKPSVVSVSTFTRRDAFGVPVGEIQNTALGYSNFEEIYKNVLSGQTIVCDDLIEKEMPAFDRTTGQRLATNRKAMIPHLKYEK